MANKYMKKCSISERHKSTHNELSFPVRMAFIKKRVTNSGKDVDKGDL